MFGKNQVLKPENHDGKRLAVQEIFATLQGEGMFVGQPAVFIRLGGCNLACNFCDTEFDSFVVRDCQEIIEETRKLALNSNQQRVRNLVVITGGEPMRQPIESLCEQLLQKNFLVQIETNGTIFRKLDERVKIICSPKVSNGSYHKIHPQLLAKISALKFLISANNQNYSKIGEVGQNSAEISKKIPIYLQPIDEYDQEKNRQNALLALDLCQKEGYFLSLQTHKILGIS